MFEITVIVGTINYLWGKAPHNFGIPDAPGEIGETIP